MPVLKLRSRDRYMYPELQSTMMTRRLIGVATLSNPVLKKEAQDLSFKLKLDI
jgi:hypothetical protein